MPRTPTIASRLRTTGLTVAAEIVAQAQVADDFPMLARTPALAAMKALDKAFAFLSVRSGRAGNGGSHAHHPHCREESHSRPCPHLHDSRAKGGASTAIEETGSWSAMGRADPCRVLRIYLRQSVARMRMPPATASTTLRALGERSGGYMG